MDIARLRALITAEDGQFRRKMADADRKGKETARSIGSSFANLKLNVPGVSGLSKVAGEAKSAFAGAFAGLGTELLAAGVGKVTQAFSLAIKTGLDFNKMMEGAGVVFENFAGSAEGAQKHLNDLKEFARTSPFDLPDLIQASARMQAFGTDIRQVVPDLKNLQNAAALAAGTSGNFTEALGGITNALGQMRAKGSVSAEEMQQLAERGIPAWDLLAKKIGKTVEETRKLAEQGKLRGAPAADALLEAFGEGQFAGLGAKLAKTTLGEESNLRDTLVQQAGDAAKESTEAYKAALAEGIKRVNSEQALQVGKAANAPVASGLQLATDISSGATTAKDIGAALIPTAKDTVKELTSILSSGLSSAWSIAKEVASGVAESAGVEMGESAIKGTKNSLKSQSPSQVYIQIGEDAAEGFVIGFENGKKKILSQQEKLVEEIKKQYARLTKAEKDAFDEASKKTGLPVDLLMGVASRETNMKNIIGDRGRGAGVMQVDIGTDAAFKASGAWKDATASIIKGAEILKDKFDQLLKLANEEVTIRSRAGEKFKFTVPELSGEQLKQTAVASYNSGLFAARNVSLGRSVDASTTGRDYSADVLQRAEIFKKLKEGTLSASETLKGQFRDAINQTTQTLKALPQTVAHLVPMNAGAALGGPPLAFAGAFLPTPPKPTVGSMPDKLPIVDTSNLVTAAMKRLNEASVPLPSAMQQMAQKTRNWTDEIIQATGKFSTAEERLGSFKERLGQGFDDLIGALVTGSDRWQDVAKNVAVDFFNTLASEMMLSATGGKYGSLGGLLGGLVGGLFGGFFGFGGGKAVGGPVMAGTPYLVGERGPELFMPGSNGSIVPANQTRQMMSGQSMTVINNFTIQAPRGTVTPETQQQIAAKAAQGLNAAMARNS